MEDILADPSSIPFTSQIDDALSPHTAVLQQIFDEPETVDPAIVPAKRWLLASNRPLEKTLIPYSGNLSVIERAQVANWFENKISLNTKYRHRWVGSLPLAHAFTLLLAFRIKTADENLQYSTESEILDIAWESQGERPENAALEDVDVETEALLRLEEEMFEVSQLAGISGNHQWGLDVGDHQDDHDPYRSAKSEWHYDDRYNSESELTVSLVFSSNIFC